MRTGLNRAAARRFLLTLRDLGYVCSDGRTFSLTPRVLELGYSYLSSLPVWEIARPYLEQLAAEVNETTSASVLDRDDIVFVARIEANRIMSMNLGVGSRLPAWATAMGRVLLANLPDGDLDAAIRRAKLTPLTPMTVTDRKDLRRIIEAARRDGWTLVDQEVEEGVRSVAVPIVSPSGAGPRSPSRSVRTPTGWTSTGSARSSSRWCSATAGRITEALAGR